MGLMTKHLLLVTPLLLALLAGCNPPDSTPLAQRASTLELHYAPTENLEALDAATFRGARRSIDLCAYSLTDHALVDALRSAAQRGVRIRIYLDQTQTRGELSHERRRESAYAPDDLEAETVSVADLQALTTLAETPNVTVRVKHSRTLMHLKSYVVDSTILRSGSANFSPTGEKRQDNDLSFTRDPRSVQAFTANFEDLWNRPDNTPIQQLLRN